MTKVVRIEAKDGAGARVAGPRVRLNRPQGQPRSQYYAFLSYSHKDEELAGWLHRELEEFHVPPALTGELTANGVIPRKLAPIFRDKQELAAATDLGEEIRAALAASQFLVVLCSPAAASSRWTNAEIEAFKRSRPDGCVLAVLASGEPFASDIPGRETEECFPPALRERYDKRGRPTGKRAEPIAADLRGGADERRLGFLKLVAGMLGVGLDDLVRRETTRKQRRMAWVTGSSLVGMVIASGLAITAIQSRDAARDQRREAEGMVAFMLGDLKDKLEPIGKLDALDGVGARVLAYYAKQDAGELSDAALLQRSRALSLTAEVAYARGDIETALRLYREAMAGTGEAIRRNGSDPQRLFDHAQNVFWTADIQRQLGKVAEAEAGMREYKRLADQMVALEPNSMKWRMEQQSADFNLGIMLVERRKFGEAIRQFTRSMSTMEALAAADPRNRDYPIAVTESLTWLADARMALGQLAEAIPIREQLVAKLQHLLRTTGDVVYRQKLVPAERSLGELFWYRGQVPEALVHFRAAADHSDALLAREPENSRWSFFSARARLNLALGLLAAGGGDDAAAEATAACTMAQRLVAIDSNVQRWRAVQRDCWLMRARLALKRNDLEQAPGFAQRAVAAARAVSTSDPTGDKYGVAEAFRLLGDTQQRLGDAAGARAAWTEGLGALPPGVAERPSEMAGHAILLRRLGRTDEARERIARLTAMGYRDPEFRST